VRFAKNLMTNLGETYDSGRGVLRQFDIIVANKSNLFDAI